MYNYICHYDLWVTLPYILFFHSDILIERAISTTDFSKFSYLSSLIIPHVWNRFRILKFQQYSFLERLITTCKLKKSGPVSMVRSLDSKLYILFFLTYIFFFFGIDRMFAFKFDNYLWIWSKISARKEKSRICEVIKSETKFQNFLQTKKVLKKKYLDLSWDSTIIHRILNIHNRFFNQ